MNHQLSEKNLKVASDHGVRKLQVEDKQSDNSSDEEVEVEEKTNTTTRTISEQLANASALPSLPKRTKPRRISGTEGCRLTEETFRNSRPLLTRDDSISLMKHRITNSVPYAVPMEEPEEIRNIEPEQQEPITTSASRSPPRRQNSQHRPAPQRINRRRKPRRVSGEAVADQSRPVLLRDDSLLLMKKKMAGMTPITLETEPPTLDGKEGANGGVDDAEQNQSGSKRRLSAAEKQKRFVRQNSLTAPSA